MIRCKECSYHKQSCQGFIECNITSGRGPDDADVMVLFDSLFTQDVQSEVIGSSSEYNQYLEKYLKKIDLDLNSVYRTSFIKCFMSDKSKKPTKPMKKKCVDLYLDKEIKQVKPKVIFLIGKMATQWFIPDLDARAPLKQVIGETFYSTEYDCHLIPVYDMFYLTNFSNRSVQIKKTEKAFAKARAVLNKEIIRNQDKVKYSSDLSDLKTLGQHVACDLETTGLNFLEDKIVTISLTDIKTKQTVSFDAENYDAITICPKCKGDKEIEEIIELKTKTKKKVVSCPKCDGAGKVVKDNLSKNKFYTDVLPTCVREMRKRKTVYHNAIFDLKMFLGAGYDLCDNLLTDTRLMQFLINPLGANALGFLVQLYYGVAYKEDIDRKYILAMSMEDRRYYCAEDTYYTAKLFQDLYKQHKSKESFTSVKLLTNIIKVIASNLEFKGIKVDADIADLIIDFYQGEKDRFEDKFKKRFDLPEEFNLNSSKQLQKLLFEDLGLPVVSTTASGNPSTNEEALRKLASKRPILKTLLEYRTVKGHIEKLKGYKRAIAKDGRVHSSFNVFSPDSSRLMSSKPNIQNVPRQSRIKEIFVAEEGYSYVYYDYSQIEFRIWLALANDTKGLDFVNRGRDIHAFIASQVYKEAEEKFLKPHRSDNPEYDEKRNKVKTIVYGSMYGRSPEGIVAEHGGSIDEAEQIQRTFFRLCREGHMWLKQIEGKVFQDKKLFTPFGTIRLFPDIELASKNKREEIIRQAKSFIVQSWAVEMVFIGMYNVWSKIRELGLDAHYVHQIHDAGILEVKDSDVEKVKELVLNYAQNPYGKLKVPLEVEMKIGKSWAEIA